MGYCRHIWLALGILLSIPSVWAGEAGIVALVNPGFELDADNDGVPDGWLRDSRAQTSGVAVDRKVKKEGLCSVRLEPAEGGANNVGQFVRVEAGALYRVSVWIRTENLKPVEGTVIAGSLSIRSVGYVVLERAIDHTGTADWVREVVDFLGPREGKAEISLSLANWGRVTGSAWFDGVELVRLAPKEGIAALLERPRAVRPLAEWAIRRQPQDCEALAAALDTYYRQRRLVPHREVERGAIARYLDTLLAAGPADPKVQSLVTRLYGEHAWRMCHADLAGDDARKWLEAALAQAPKDPEDAGLARSARLGLARVAILQGNQPVAPVATSLKEAIGDQRSLRREFVELLLRDASHLQRRRDSQRARRVYDILFAVLPGDDPQRLAAESAHLSLLMAGGDADAARAAAQKILAPERKAPVQLRSQALLALCQLSAGNAKEVQQWLTRADEAFANNPAARAAFHLDFAQALAKDRRWPDVVRGCLRLVASYPQQTRTCFEAQKLLVQASMEQRLHDQALAAAKVLYGAAPNSEKEITEAVNLVMQMLKAKTRSIALANRFVAFQAHGPNGEDGKPDTEDDLVNPLAKVQYTPLADVEALFKKTLEGLPEDFAGRRWRGYLYLYWGKPKLALKEFVWRFDHAPLQERAINEAIDDIVVGLKAYFGHTLAGEQFMDYQKYGPEGEDGKKGTPDDLKDVLEGLFKTQ